MKTKNEKQLNGLAKSLGIKSKAGRKAFREGRNGLARMETKLDEAAGRKGESVALREGRR